MGRQIFPCPFCGYDDTPLVEAERERDELRAEAARLRTERDEAEGKYLRQCDEYDKQGQEVAALRAEVERLRGDRAHALELLAVVHRDGGHYINDHGFDAACRDGQMEIVNTRAEVDKWSQQSQIASDFVRFVWGDVLGKTLPEVGDVNLDDLRKEIARMAMREEHYKDEVARLRLAICPDGSITDVAELEDHAKELNTIYDGVCEKASELSGYRKAGELVEEVSRLRSALEFYAGRRQGVAGTIYEVTNGDTWHHDGVSKIMRDKGAKARAALEVQDG